ncbi:MAG: hypothetical protein JWN29_718 [Acidimicrobiales bacterium]|nr:hypothetical protein [Acidimicrobiales bacterium]
MARPGGDDGQDMIEVLNELRVVLPGVQVLFAFLLTVPFTQRFGLLGRTDRALYFAALLLTAASSIALIAPSVHARLTSPDRRTERVVAVSNLFIVVGSSLLAAGMGCVVYLIADLLYQSVLAAIVTTVLVVVVAFCWYGIPLLDRRMRR